MVHGSEAYFHERARFERRLSLLCVGVSLVVLSFETALLLPAVRRAVTEALQGDPLHPRRFGFEGPEQYVRRVTLETNGPPGPLAGRPTVVFPSVRTVKGGRSGSPTSDDPHARPETRRPGLGAGDSPRDLYSIARIIYGGSGPVMRSEDFIVEHMEKPEYPEGPLARNSEGLVALGAVVDTTGAVTRVDLVSSPGDRELEAAAIAAARRYRFRPYRIAGRVTEAYAIIRFDFRIYD
jgi:periplasmic protein TonB